MILVSVYMGDAIAQQGVLKEGTVFRQKPFVSLKSTEVIAVQRVWR